MALLEEGCFTYFAIVRWKDLGRAISEIHVGSFLLNLPFVFGEHFIMMKAFFEALPVLLSIILLFSSSTTSSLPSAAVKSSHSKIQGNVLAFQVFETICNFL